jgi:hypothetical protein
MAFSFSSTSRQAKYSKSAPLSDILGVIIRSEQCSKRAIVYMSKCASLDELTGDVSVSWPLKSTPSSKTVASFTPHENDIGRNQRTSYRLFFPILWWGFGTDIMRLSINFFRHPLHSMRSHRQVQAPWGLPSASQRCARVKARF